MITLQALDNAVKFTFDDNQHYLFNGTIEVPLNALTLVTDDSEMATFKKAATNDIFLSCLYSELGMTKSELESFYKENMVGGGTDEEEVQELIDAAVVNFFDGVEYDNQTSRINFKHGSTVKGYIDAAPFIVDGMVSNVEILNGNLVISFNTDAGKQPISIPLTDIFNPNNYYDKNEVDGLLNDKLNITDFHVFLDNVVTSISEIEAGMAEDEEVTASALNDLKAKIDKKQDTLVSGTNIKTINNESIIGSGNIDIQGGGKTVSAGTNISITTGETADTINCTIPYSDVANSNTDIILGKDMPSVSDYNRVYYGKKIASRENASFAYSIGIGVPPSTNSSDYNELYGSKSIGIGAFKIGNGNQYAHFVDGCVAIGYGAKTRISNAVAIGTDTEASGTTKTNINNQLTIDTSNQVYIYNKDNTEMICLQDQLGGGGSSYTAGDGIDITNDVISVTGKVDTSAITTSMSSASTDSQIPSAKAVYDQFGGLKLVKLTQAEYDALTEKDSMTLYII